MRLKPLPNCISTESTPQEARKVYTNKKRTNGIQVHKKWYTNSVLFPSSQTPGKRDGFWDGAQVFFWDTRIMKICKLLLCLSAMGTQNLYVYRFCPKPSIFHGCFDSQWHEFNFYIVFFREMVLNSFRWNPEEAPPTYQWRGFGYCSNWKIDGSRKSHRGWFFWEPLLNYLLGLAKGQANVYCGAWTVTLSPVISPDLRRLGGWLGYRLLANKNPPMTWWMMGY